MAKKPKRVELKFVAGFNPEPDSTALDTLMATDGDKVRFYNGRPQTVGGCLAISTGSSTILGTARFLYNYRKDDTSTYSIIGTNQKLYTLLGNVLTNITPLLTSTTAIANSLATNYATLGASPLATTSGSKTIVATWSSHKLQVGDYVSITGAATTNNIPDTEINAVQYVQAVTTNTFTFTVATTSANATGSGGGAAVVVATDLITVTHASHGFATGDRVKIAGAAATGGISATYINAEHIIRKNDANTYTFTCAQHYATSSVSAAGGAGTTEQGEISDGQVDATAGYGYGMGLYGVGLYGVAKTGYYPGLPRVWSGDPFGNYMILCPGTTGNAIGASIYQWAGSTDTAPTVVSGAPTDATYVFVDNNILVALCSNVVKWSDQGDQTNWTAAATNQAGSQTLYGAGRLLSRAFVGGENLIFSSTDVYRMRYIGKPYVWEFEKQDVSDGISGIHAAAAYDGAIYWMGRKDFYYYNGGNVRTLAPSSLRQYIFGRVKSSQCAKTHAWLNTRFGEIWWFYQSTNASEIDSYVAYSIPEKCFFYGSWARTASERNYIQDYQRLIGSDNIVYQHEYGTSDNGSALNPYFVTNYRQVADGDDTMDIMGLMMDAVQTGTMSLYAYTRLSPHSTTERTFGPYSISASDSTAITKVDFRAHGRQVKYKFGGSATSSFFRLGKIYEYLQLADGR